LATFCCPSRDWRIAASRRFLRHCSNASCAVT
jgi:hypothetical protein